jgi:hypothetical protein
MSAIFEMPIPSETLEPDEVEKISGCSRRAEQIEWLKRHEWVFVKNHAGAPIIGLTGAASRRVAAGRIQHSITGKQCDLRRPVKSCRRGCWREREN